MSAPARPSSRDRQTVPPTYVDANRVWVDSRLRAALAQRVELPALRRLGATAAPGGRAVEIGPGRRALGSRYALEHLGAAHVDAYDLYPPTVERARERSRDLAGRLDLHVGDATALPVPDGSVDLVVCSHAFHHVEDWRAAVGEVARVLRPGGWLGFAEMTARFVDAPWLRAVSRHPADRFSTDELVAAMAAHGLEVGDRLSRRLGDRWVLGAARKH